MFNIHDHPCFKEKMIYFGFLCITFILLMITLTTNGWEDGHMILNAGEKWINGNDLFLFFFLFILLSIISIGISLIFFFLSFYKEDRIVNNISCTARSLSGISLAAGFCMGTSIWIPIKTGDSISDLGYDYVILLIATFNSIFALIAGYLANRKLTKLKPDWRQDFNMCTCIQSA